MLGVGLVATFASSAGFVAVHGAPPGRIRRDSLWLLAATLVAAGASFVFRGDPTRAVAIPVVALALLRRALAARLRTPAGSLNDVRHGQEASTMRARRLGMFLAVMVCLTLWHVEQVEPQSSERRMACLST